MYDMAFTRPNISHAVGVLRMYMSTSGKEHLNAVKRVFRYIPGTMIMEYVMEEIPRKKMKSMCMALSFFTRTDISITNDR